VTLRLSLGPHPCKPFSLVTSPRLGLRHLRSIVLVINVVLLMYVVLLQVFIVLVFIMLLVFLLLPQILIMLCWCSSCYKCSCCLCSLSLSIFLDTTIVVYHVIVGVHHVVFPLFMVGIIPTLILSYKLKFSWRWMVVGYLWL